MLRDVLSRKGIAKKFGGDLDGRATVDLSGSCMKSEAPLVRSGGSFKTGRVRGGNVQQLGRSETFDSV